MLPTTTMVTNVTKTALVTNSTNDNYGY